MHQPPPQWDAPLAAAFKDLQALSIRINLAARSRSQYDVKDFCSIIATVQSRLLYLRRGTRSLGLYSVPEFPYVGPIAIDIEGPFREFMRLAMLAFLTTTFKAIGNSVPFQWIGAQLEEIVPKLFDHREQEDDEFLLWGLAIAGSSVVSPDRTWFRRAWMKIAPGLGWDAVRERLTRVMWVEIAHDAIGEAMFDVLQHPKHD